MRHLPGPFYLRRFNCIELGGLRIHVDTKEKRNTPPSNARLEVAIDILLSGALLTTHVP
jgi:hypothetical protein